MPGTVPRGEAIHISAPLSLGSARCLFRPIFLCYSLYHAPGLFPCFFILPLAEPASHPAYAPTTKSPARYSAGRAKQHNHARNVKPLPPRRSPGRTLPGQEGGGQCPLPLPANLSVLLTLPCPGALSLSFHLLPGRTCPQALACSLPFGKKRKNPRSSMRCRLNQCRGLHLLSPYPSFFLPLFSVKQKKSPQALFRCSYGQPPYPRPILAATSPSISSAAH